MKKIVYISDFFSDEVAGGAEIYDSVLINELKNNINLLKNYVKKKFRQKSAPKFLYGGSVEANNIQKFKSISELDGFLIGGASKSSKKFIDIIKNFYK